MGYLQEEEDDPKIIVEEEMQQPVLLLVSEFIFPIHMDEYTFGHKLALIQDKFDYLCEFHRHFVQSQATISTIFLSQGN